MAKLLDYEWKFLLQLVSRIDAAEGYEETCRVLMEHLQTVLPFDRAFCLHIGREEGRVSISEPVNYRLSDDYSVFLNGSYPRWSEFIMSPSSMVFSQSELVEDGVHPCLSGNLAAAGHLLGAVLLCHLSGSAAYFAGAVPSAGQKGLLRAGSFYPFGFAGRTGAALFTVADERKTFQ